MNNPQDITILVITMITILLGMVIYIVVKIIKFTDEQIQMIFLYLKNLKIKYTDMSDWQFNRPKSKMYADTKTTSLDIVHQFILKIIKKRI